MYKAFFKRLIDIVLSALGIVVLAIPMLIIAIIVKIDSPGSVLFKQRRIGKNKKEFNMLKYRSMYSEAPKNMPTHLLENPDSYITTSGKFLRKYSLDELPQMFNIFKGDMSIIGPRPALWNQYDLIEERDKYGANDIKPGLTGLAQISGRDELPIQIKAKYDGEYTEGLSFIMDCRCFLKTILSVLKHDGVVEGGVKNLEKTKEIVSK